MAIPASSEAAITTSSSQHPIPGYTPVFEDAFDLTDLVSWARSNWFYSIHISIIYLILAFAAQTWMKNKSKPFQIRTFIVFWNAFLAIFSAVASWRIAVPVAAYYDKYGLERVLCDNTLFLHHGSVRFWGLAYFYSKAFELIGTFLIILNKKHLPFFHLYHHVTVLLYVWWSTRDVAANGQFLSVLNLGAHSIMYSIMLAKSLKLRVPKKLVLFENVVQIAQMAAGIYLTYVIYGVNARGEACTVSMESVKYGTFIYISYFAYFCRHFVNILLKKGKNKTKTAIIARLKNEFEMKKE